MDYPIVNSQFKFFRHSRFLRNQLLQHIPGATCEARGGPRRVVLWRVGGTGRHIWTSSRGVLRRSQSTSGKYPGMDMAHQSHAIDSFLFVISRLVHQTWSRRYIILQAWKGLVTRDIPTSWVTYTVHRITSARQPVTSEFRDITMDLIWGFLVFSFHCKCSHKHTAKSVTNHNQVFFIRLFASCRFTQKAFAANCPGWSSSTGILTSSSRRTVSPRAATSWQIIPESSTSGNIWNR